jgi:hypothetical protein
MCSRFWLSDETNETNGLLTCNRPALMHAARLLMTRCVKPWMTRAVKVAPAFFYETLDRIALFIVFAVVFGTQQSFDAAR